MQCGKIISLPLYLWYIRDNHLPYNDHGVLRTILIRELTKGNGSRYYQNMEDGTLWMIDKNEKHYRINRSWRMLFKSKL